MLFERRNHSFGSSQLSGNPTGISHRSVDWIQPNWPMKHLWVAQTKWCGAARIYAKLDRSKCWVPFGFSIQKEPIPSRETLQDWTFKYHWMPQLEPKHKSTFMKILKQTWPSPETLPALFFSEVAASIPTKIVSTSDGQVVDTTTATVVEKGTQKLPLPSAAGSRTLPRQVRIVVLTISIHPDGAQEQVGDMATQMVWHW